MTLETTEAECAANAVAPRVSLAGMMDKISGEYYFTADKAVEAIGAPSLPSLCLLTVCIIVMQNGFTIIGKSAPASAANFNADLGRKLAHEDAIRQLWPLEGYLLRSTIAA